MRSQPNFPREEPYATMKLDDTTPSIASMDDICLLCSGGLFGGMETIDTHVPCSILGPPWADMVQNYVCGFCESFSKSGVLCPTHFLERIHLRNQQVHPSVFAWKPISCMDLQASCRSTLARATRLDLSLALQN